MSESSSATTTAAVEGASATTATSAESTPATTATSTAMAPVVTVSVATPAAPQKFNVTLDEFCQRHSGRGAGAEILGAFHSVQRKLGHFVDTEAAFLARFVALGNQPVK